MSTGKSISMACFIVKGKVIRPVMLIKKGPRITRPFFVNNQKNERCLLHRPLITSCRPYHPFRPYRPCRQAYRHHHQRRRQRHLQDVHTPCTQWLKADLQHLLHSAEQSGLPWLDQ